jgi:tRNA(Ile2)-agmatinylcytidine synthase
VELHIGVDDTDSTKGGCTTYVAACIVEDLAKAGVQFIDYPNIIRLNPNIPYKTRGNAAVALRVRVPKETFESVLEKVIREVEEDSQFGEPNADPAVVFLKGPPKSEIREISRKSLSDVVSKDEALRAIRKCKATAVAYGSGLGLVGATAAIGHTLDADYTFELVAYRDRRNWGTPRLVSESSVKRMDRITAPQTFNNYDYENHRVLVTPHGPDPVLLGIRGESPRVVLKAFHMLKIHEPVERWVIFRTNHGTDAHLETGLAEGYVKLNAPTVLKGIVASRPVRIAGGHVFFALKYGRREIHCAAFEPTGRFRGIIAILVPGDQVTVYGGVKVHSGLPVTVNLEKVFINRLVDEFSLENPICPRCGKHMKSAGRAQGFRCQRCSLNARGGEKRRVWEPRKVHTGLYVPDKKAHRHLTKPLSRYGHEKSKWNHAPPSGMWHEP